MRKILKLVLGLLLVGSMVFGADTSKNFVISTTIPGVLELKISTQPVISISSWNEVADITTKSLTNKEAIQLYLHIKNNQRTNITIKATIPHMTSEGTDCVIPFTLNTLSSGTAGEQNVATIDYNKNGLRVDVVGFSIDPDNTAFTEAAVGSYSSTIIFNVYTT